MKVVIYIQNNVYYIKAFYEQTHTIYKIINELYKNNFDWFYFSFSNSLIEKKVERLKKYSDKHITISEENELTKDIFVEKTEKFVYFITKDKSLVFHLRGILGKSVVVKLVELNQIPFVTKNNSKSNLKNVKIISKIEKQLIMCNSSLFQSLSLNEKYYVYMSIISEIINSERAKVFLKEYFEYLNKYLENVAYEVLEYYFNKKLSEVYVHYFNMELTSNYSYILEIINSDLNIHDRFSILHEISILLGIDILDEISIISKFLWREV